MEKHKENEDTNHVFAMDNYFTLRKAKRIVFVVRVLDVLVQQDFGQDGC